MHVLRGMCVQIATDDRAIQVTSATCGAKIMSTSSLIKVRRCSLGWTKMPKIFSWWIQGTGSIRKGGRGVGGVYVREQNFHT